MSFNFDQTPTKNSSPFTESLKKGFRLNPSKSTMSPLKPKMQNQSIMNLEKSFADDFDKLKIDEDKKKQTNSKVQLPLYIFSPYNNIIKSWQIWMLLLLVYTAIVFPVRISFLENNYTWLILDLLVDGSFMFDVLLNFITAYEDDKGNLVTKFRFIICRYAKSWMVIDILSSIPLYLILDNSTDAGNVNNAVKLSKLPKVYKIIRVFRIIKIMRIFKLSPVIEKFLVKLKLNNDIVMIIKFVFIFLFSLHITSCFWFFFSTLEDDIINSWIYLDNKIDSSVVEQYIACLYYILTVFLTVGYGNITPVSATENVFTVLLMFFGMSFYGYVVGSLTFFFSRINEKQTLLLVRKNFYTRLAFMFKIPQNILNNILIKVHQLYDSNQNSILDIYNRETILKQLPASIYGEVCTYVFRSVLKKIDFFQDKPNLFLIKILPSLTPLFLNFGDEIYKEGDPGLDVYFIMVGRVAQVYSKAEKKKYQTFVEGSYFGEVEILFKKPRSHTAFAQSYCELWRISKDKFIELLNEYPNIKEDVCEIAKQRSMAFGEVLINKTGSEIMDLMDQTLKKSSSLQIENLNYKGEKKMKIIKKVLKEKGLKYSDITNFDQMVADLNYMDSNINEEIEFLSNSLEDLRNLRFNTSKLKSHLKSFLKMTQEMNIEY